MNREAASRFSFLLSIPIISAAGLLAGLDLAESGLQSGVGVLIVGFVAAAISAYACIHFFLAFIRRIGMLPVRDLPGDPRHSPAEFLDIKKILLLAQRRRDVEKRLNDNFSIRKTTCTNE